MSKTTGTLGEISGNLYDQNPSPSLIENSKYSTPVSNIEHLRQYFDAVPFIRLVVDADGNIQLINRAGCDILGCRMQEVVGRNWIDQFIPDDQRTQARAVSERILNGSSSTVDKLRSSITVENGKITTIEWYNVPLKDNNGKVVGLVCSGEDVTDREKAEETTKQTLQVTRTILDRLPIGALVVGKDRVIRDVNKVALDIVGRKKEEVIGHLCHHTMCPAEEGECPILDLGNDINNSEKEALDSEGKLIPILKTVIPITLDGEDVLLEAFLDNTERKQAEETFAMTVSQYMAMINAVPATMYLKDIDHKYITANNAFCKLVGMSLDDIKDKTIRDLFPPHQAEEHHTVEEQVMSEDHKVEKQEERVVRQSGEECWVTTTTVPIHDSQGLVSGVVGLTQDVTELHLSREKLVQADKMAAVGTLAAGVAHEINNPVGFISSNLTTMGKYLGKIRQSLDKMTSPDAETSEALNEMLDDFADAIDESIEGTGRVKKIVADLKSFSRVDKSQKGYFNLNEGLETTLNIVWNELKYKCTVEKNYGDIPDLYCMPNQLNQVFMNLLVNAGHAIQNDSGRITITTRTDDKNIYIAINDTGIGIPRENIKRLFEPFFTTKEIGKGTGLGLSVAYDIIEKHNGLIEVKSEVGTGAEFKITLPLEGLKRDEA